MIADLAISRAIDAARHLEPIGGAKLGGSVDARPLSGGAVESLTRGGAVTNPAAPTDPAALELKRISSIRAQRLGVASARAAYLSSLANIERTNAVFAVINRGTIVVRVTTRDALSSAAGGVIRAIFVLDTRGWGNASLFYASLRSATIPIRAALRASPCGRVACAALAIPVRRTWHYDVTRLLKAARTGTAVAIEQALDAASERVASAAIAFVVGGARCRGL